MRRHIYKQRAAPTEAQTAAAFVPILVGGGGAPITFVRRRRRVKFFSGRHSSYTIVRPYTCDTYFMAAI